MPPPHSCAFDMVSWFCFFNLAARVSQDNLDFSATIISISFQRKVFLFVIHSSELSECPFAVQRIPLMVSPTSGTAEERTLEGLIHSSVASGRH